MLIEQTLRRIAGPIFLVIALGATSSCTGKDAPTFLAAPTPSPNYSESVATDGLVILSGQIGSQPGSPMPADFESQSRQTMENIAAALHRRGLTMDNVVKCTVLLVDMDRWEAFNTVYRGYFKRDRLPTRTAFGVNALPLNAQIEVECWAAT